MWHQLGTARSRIVRYVIQRGALPVLSLIALAGCGKKGASFEQEASFGQFIVDFVKQNVAQGKAGPQKEHFLDENQKILKDGVNQIANPPLSERDSIQRSLVARVMPSGMANTPLLEAQKEENDFSPSDEMPFRAPKLLEEMLARINPSQMSRLSDLGADALGIMQEEVPPLLNRFDSVWQNTEKQTVQQFFQLVGKLVRIAKKAPESGDKANDKMISTFFDFLEKMLVAKEQTETTALAGRALPMLREIVESKGARTVLADLILSFQPEDLPLLEKIIPPIVALKAPLSLLSKQQLQEILAVALQGQSDENMKPADVKRGMEMFAKLSASSEYRNMVAAAKDLLSEWCDKVHDQGQRDQAITRLLRIVETLSPAKSSGSKQQPGVDKQVENARVILAEIPKYKDTIALALPLLSQLSDEEFKQVAKVIVGAVQSSGGSGLGALTPTAIYQLLKHGVALLEHAPVLQALPGILTALQNCGGQDPVQQIAAVRGALLSTKEILLSESYEAARVRSHMMGIVGIAKPEAVELLSKLLADRQKLRVVLDSGYRVFDEEQSKLRKLVGDDTPSVMGSLREQCSEEIEKLRKMGASLGGQDREKRVTRLLRLAKILRESGLLKGQNVRLRAESVCSHVELAAHLSDEIDSGVRFLLSQKEQDFGLILGFLQWAGKNRQKLLAKQQNQEDEANENLPIRRLSPEEIKAENKRKAERLKHLVKGVVGLAENMEGWQQLLPLVPRFVYAASGHSSRQELAQTVSDSLPFIAENLLAANTVGMTRRGYLRNIIEYAGPSQALDLFDAVLGCSEGRGHLENIQKVFPSIQEFVDASESLREFSQNLQGDRDLPLLVLGQRQLADSKKQLRRKTKKMIDEIFSHLESFKWAMNTFREFSEGDSLRWFRENDDQQMQDGFNLAVALVPHLVGLQDRLGESGSLFQLKNLLWGFVDWETKTWEQRWNLIYGNLDLVQKELLDYSLDEKLRRKNVHAELLKQPWKRSTRKHVHEILSLVAKPHAALFNHMVIRQNNRRKLAKILAMLQKVWDKLESGEQSNLIKTGETLYGHYHEQLQAGMENGAGKNTEKLLVGLASSQGQKLIEDTLRLLTASQGTKDFTAALKKLLKGGDNLGEQIHALIKSAQELQKTGAAGKLYLKLHNRGLLPPDVGLSAVRDDMMGYEKKLHEDIKLARDRQNMPAARKLYDTLRKVEVLESSTTFSTSKKDLLKRVALNKNVRNWKKREKNTEDVSLELPIRVVTWVNSRSNGSLRDLDKVKDLLGEVEQMLVSNPEFFTIFSGNKPDTQKVFALLTGLEGEKLISELYAIAQKASLTDFQNIEKLLPSKVLVQVLEEVQKWMPSTSDEAAEGVDPFKKVQWWLSMASENPVATRFLMKTFSLGIQCKNFLSKKFLKTVQNSCPNKASEDPKKLPLESPKPAVSIASPSLPKAQSSLSETLRKMWVTYGFPGKLSKEKGPEVKSAPQALSTGTLSPEVLRESQKQPSSHEAPSEKPGSLLSCAGEFLENKNHLEALPKLLHMYKTWGEANPIGLADKDKTWVTLATSSVQLAQVAIDEQRQLKVRLEAERQRLAQQEQPQAPTEQVERPVAISPLELDAIDVTHQRDLLLAGWEIAENLGLDPRRAMAASASAGKINRVFSAAATMQSASLAKLPVLEGDSKWWLDLLFKKQNKSTIFEVLNEVSKDLDEDVSVIKTVTRIQEKVMKLDRGVFKELSENSDGDDVLKKSLFSGLERLFRSKNNKASPMAVFMNIHLELRRIEKLAPLSEQESLFGQGQPEHSDDQSTAALTTNDFMQPMKKLQKFMQNKEKGLPKIYELIRELFLPPEIILKKAAQDDSESEHTFWSSPDVAVPAG